MIEAANTPASLVQFSAPNEALGGIDAETAGAMVALASDIALVVDGHGVILDAAFGELGSLKIASRDWIGQRWADLVTVDSRQKIEETLRDATHRSPTRWRHVNHHGERRPRNPRSL